MSLSLLPRGVAARKALANPNPESGKMDVDISHDTSSTSLPISTSEDLKPAMLDSKRGLASRETKNWQAKKQNPKPIEPKELAILLEASISDYSLWKNQDLRRYAADKNTQGYISLSRLISDAPLFASLDQSKRPNEAQILQALKIHGTGFLELQMKVVSTSQYKFSTTSYSEDFPSTYNIRRRDWSSIREKKDPDVPLASRKVKENDQEMTADLTLWDRTKDDWDARTIYVENVPRSYWSIPGILAFISFLLPKQVENEANSPSNYPGPKVQFVELPKHAKALEGDVPICKGFAFVTLETSADADSLVQKWPWFNDSSGISVHIRSEEGAEETEQTVEDQLMNLDLTKEKDEHLEAEKEANESSFRVLSMSKWNALKEQYLEQQMMLLEKVKTTKYSQSFIPPRSSVPNPQKASYIGNTLRDRPPHISSRKADSSGPANQLPLPNLDERRRPEDTRSAIMERGEALGYPPDCLIFVKNLHLGTNKTTLKSLFGRAFTDEGGSSTFSTSGGEIDYVDYQKGMESCHIRLSHPGYAQTLVKYLSSQLISQSDGLDATGRPVVHSTLRDGRVQPISAELVQGRAEAIYWEKVPEKVKNAAVVKLKTSKPTAIKGTDLHMQNQNTADTLASIATPTSIASGEDITNERGGTTSLEEGAGFKGEKKVAKRVQEPEEEDLNREKKRRRKV